MTIPADVQALIDRAKAMQRDQERCERVHLGHNYFGIGPSLILYPQEFFDPGWVNREIFAGRLDPWARYSLAWRCGYCGQSVSMEEAHEYHEKVKPQIRIYYGSRLWC